VAGALGTTGGGKTMSEADVELRPVDYVLVAFPLNQANCSWTDRAEGDGQQHRAGA
jgi:hypothetical protein